MLPGPRTLARSTIATTTSDASRDIPLPQGLVLTVTNYRVGPKRSVLAVCEHDGQELLVLARDLLTAGPAHPIAA